MCRGCFLDKPTIDSPVSHALLPAIWLESHQAGRRRAFEEIARICDETGGDKVSGKKGYRFTDGVLACHDRLSSCQSCQHNSCTEEASDLFPQTLHCIDKLSLH